MAQYYYLVSSLPDIFLDAPKQKEISSLEILRDFEEHLAKEDLLLLDIFRAPFDNFNLITLLKDLPREFDRRGKFTKDELESFIKTGGGPSYIEEFLNIRREGKNIFPGMIEEDILNLLFYEEVIQHPNSFVSEWFYFERSIKNFLVALSFRKYKKTLPLEKLIIGHDEITQSILKSSSSDFSLGNLYPWVEKIVSIPANELVKREKIIDEIKWEKLDELSYLYHFGVETLLAFFVKFCIAERWMKLDPVEGKKKFENLISVLTQNKAIKIA